MRRSILLLMLIFGIYCCNIKSQMIRTMDNTHGKEVNSNSTTDKTGESGIVVNLEMIERFNSVTVDGEYLSWRDLITGYDIQSIKDLYYAYINCDFENESMQDIKLVLEEKGLKNIIKESDTEYFAEIMRKYIEINTPNSKKMFVQKID